MCYWQTITVRHLRFKVLRYTSSYVLFISFLFSFLLEIKYLSRKNVCTIILNTYQICIAKGIVI